MKIISGERKGHVLATPAGRETRPTLSRVRESLFSIIAGDIPGSTFYDLFAGAGAIGLEAMSRGASRGIFVESAREPYRCLVKNIEKLRYTQSTEAHFADATRWKLPSTDGTSIVFADPPYRTEVIESFLHQLSNASISAECLVILQLPDTYRKDIPFLKHLRTETYGGTILNFYLGLS